jgi:hypothetical protein
MRSSHLLQWSLYLLLSFVLLSDARPSTIIKSRSSAMRLSKSKSATLMSDTLKYFRESLSSVWTKALRQSLYEQSVEDENSVYKFENHVVRRLIVMPLSDRFEPNEVNPMHGKIQYGDKCSLPISLGRFIFEKRFEVPWLFELVPVRHFETSCAPQRLRLLRPAQTTEIVDESCQSPNGASASIIDVDLERCFKGGKLSKAYISPLDFRAPDNYIFLPHWLMHDLNLKTNDLVDISFVRIKLASLVVLQPLTPDWDLLVKDHKDPKSLLEHELNKYSSLTSGSTIYLNIQNKEYSFYVKETLAEGGVSVHGVRIQDADVHTDIDRSLIDKLSTTKL